VAGHDKRCRLGVCPAIEFSEVMSFEVAGAAVASPAAFTSTSVPSARTAAINCAASAVPAAPPLPSTSGGPGPDRIRPIEVLSFAPVQDIDKLIVKARMSEEGTLTARASVSVAGASKTYRFKTVKRSVAANVQAKLRLKLAKKQLKAVKRALKKRKRLKAKITVTAADRAKNKRSQRATVRLRD
jgi:hypothetical protein